MEFHSCTQNFAFVDWTSYTPRKQDYRVLKFGWTAFPKNMQPFRGNFIAVSNKVTAARIP
jgi:hypothetical protein